MCRISESGRNAHHNPYMTLCCSSTGISDCGGKNFWSILEIIVPLQRRLATLVAGGETYK